AARHVGGQHQQHVGRLGGAHGRRRQRRAYRQQQQDAPDCTHHGSTSVPATPTVRAPVRRLRPHVRNSPRHGLIFYDTGAPCAMIHCVWRYSANARAVGKPIATSVPELGALVMLKRAWLASASALVSGSPSPVPPEREAVASCRNGSSAVAISFSFMPTP